MISDAGPLTVQTAGGPSILYQGRNLYSSHDPGRSPCEAVKRTVILPESLVICVSPALGYGLEALLAKLPEHSFVLAIERDLSLFELSASSIPERVLRDSRFRLACIDSPARLPQILDELPGKPFRRCLRIDLSGGARLDAEFYSSLFSLADSLISTFWKNRLTLMHLGRIYTRNLLVNAALIPRSYPVRPSSSTKPVLVAGAGPSLDSTLAFAREYRDRIFLLAVDTALGALGEASLTPDAVVLVESQFWISRAFLGFASSGIPVYADMTARPDAVTATGGPIHFFHTPYADSPFLARFAASGLAPFVVPRLGSVGLVALHLARYLAGNTLPVFFTGLDFSWGSGMTHARGASPTLAAYLRSTRLAPAGGDPALFPAHGNLVAGKDGRPVRTDPVLSGYADMCRDFFSRDAGTFDLGESGLVTGCRRLSLPEAEAIISATTKGQESTAAGDAVNLAARDKGGVRMFLEEERGRLIELKDILVGNGNSREKRLTELLGELDYLYLHFPDGHRGWRTEQDFLNRIRVETEYFLKVLSVRALGS